MELFRWPIKKKKRALCVYVLYTMSFYYSSSYSHSCLGFSVCRSILFLFIFLFFILWLGQLLLVWCSHASSALKIRLPIKYTYTQREREEEEEEVQGDWIQPPITKKKKGKILKKLLLFIFNDNKELWGPSQFEIKTNDLWFHFSTINETNNSI